MPESDETVMQPTDERSWEASGPDPVDAPADDAVPPAEPDDEAPAAATVTPPASKAPASKAPAKRAPAKKAPAKKAAAKKAPAKKAPAVPALDGPARSAPPAPAADLVPGLQQDTTVLPARRSWRDAWPRLVVLLTLLLLSAAIAMGVAALVMQGPTTWQAQSAVRLAPDKGATRAQLGQVAGRLHLLTGSASALAGVPERDVRADLSPKQLAPDEMAIVARTAGAQEAQALAIAAASLLASGQGADGVPLVVSSSLPKPEQSRPSLVTALVTGSLAGAGFLLLVGSARLVRGSRNT